ncbi:MAG: hypothetical protein WC378_13975, partial [Opitutaceae bacterium]
MRTLYSFLAVLCFAGAVSAQQVDGAGDIFVSMQAQVIWGNPNVPPAGQNAHATMTCTALAATQPDANLHVDLVRGSSLPQGAYTNRLNTRFVPGVYYDVVFHVDNNFDPEEYLVGGAPGLQLLVSAPEGYAVEVKKPDLIYPVEGDRTNINLNVFEEDNNVQLKVRLRPLGGNPGLRAGFATSLRTDRVLWQLSLGELSNGNPAGCLSFTNLIGADTLRGMLTRQKLNSDASSSEILQVVDIGDARVLRQIIAPQVCVDITGTLDSGVITLNCYHPSQRSATADPNTHYFSFTGTPYTSYTVTPGTDDSTGATISCSILDLATSSTARVLETKLTRTGSSPNYTWTSEYWHTGAAPVKEVKARSG